MKNIDNYLKSNTKESSMRLAMIRLVNTSIFIGVVICLGVVAGFILGIVLNKDLALISSSIGAFAGLSGALIGAFLIPAIGGKVGQSFNEKNTTENKVADIINSSNVKDTTNS